MTCMMSGGIGFRAAGIFPDIFVAFFYSGLGCALALAGVVFTGNYFCYKQLIAKEGNPLFILYGILTLTLCGGDAFHLVPRIIRSVHGSLPSRS